MTQGAVAEMAKKASRPKSVARTDDDSRQPMIVQMRGSAEFKAYVQRGADFARQPVAKMAELAIIQYLRSIGFTEEPPRR